MCNAGTGIIGNYTFCTISTKSIVIFIPNDNANPYIGKQNKLELVEKVDKMIPKEFVRVLKMYYK